MDPEKRARAGAWLKRERERRRISVRKIAAYFDVSTQSVYGWESGGSDFVDDDRAAGLAEILQMDLIAVRRGLGLWVPSDWSATPPMSRRDELLAHMRTDPEFRAEVGRVVVDALQSMAGSGHDDESTEPDSDEQQGHKAS